MYTYGVDITKQFPLFITHISYIFKRIYTPHHIIQARNDDARKLDKCKGLNPQTEWTKLVRKHKFVSFLKISFRYDPSNGKIKTIYYILALAFYLFIFTLRPLSILF